MFYTGEETNTKQNCDILKKYLLQVFGASSRPSDCLQRHWKLSRKVIRRHRRALLNHFSNRSHFRRQYLSPRIEVASTGPILSKFRFAFVRDQLPGVAQLDLF